MNSLDPNNKFIFEHVITVANFLVVSCSIKMINLYLIFTTNLHIRSLTSITAAVTRNTLKTILFCHRGKESFK